MARLCKKEELYDYQCGDYLLWRENRKRERHGPVLYVVLHANYISLKEAWDDE